MIASHDLQAELWKNVQRVYAQSKAYRAADDPAYREALRRWDACFNGDAQPPDRRNVLSFRKPRRPA